MRCPSCGTENPDTARFCANCGTTLRPDDERPVADTASAPDATPTEAPGTAGVAAGAESPRAAMAGVATGGWLRATAWAGATFLALVVLAELLAVLQSQTEAFGGGVAGPGVPFELTAVDVIRSGLLTVYQFLHVAIEFDFPIGAFAPGVPPSLDLSASFALAMMLATGLAAWMLFLGGRSVARAADGPDWARPVHGAKVAIPFVLLALAVSFAAGLSFDLTELGAPVEPGTEFSARASPPSVFVWPLLLALVAGAAGGWSTARDRLLTGRWGPRARGALAGGWRMAWVTVALSFVGLLVLAAVHPDQTAGYFRIVGELGGLGGTFFVLATLLFLPNMATWVAAGALGGSAISLGMFGQSCNLVSYLAFPAGTVEGAPDIGPEAFVGDPCGALEAGVRFEAAPAGYFLFLLVPIAAVLLGGWHAARRADATTRSEAALAGAGAGAVFALWMLLLLLLSRFTVGISGFFGLFQGGSFSFGPGILSGFGLALLWGIVGGALAGLLAARRAPPAEPAAAGPEDRDAWR